MRLNIIGKGCPRCKILETYVKSSLEENGLTGIIVLEMNKAEEKSYHQLSNGTPFLFIDDEIVFSDYFPTKDEVFNLIKMKFYG